jgi:outer membrane protein TolC
MRKFCRTALILAFCTGCAGNRSTVTLSESRSTTGSSTVEQPELDSQVSTSTSVSADVPNDGTVIRTVSFCEDSDVAENARTPQDAAAERSESEEQRPSPNISDTPGELTAQSVLKPNADDPAMASQGAALNYDGSPVGSNAVAAQTIQFDQVVDSVYRSYPLLQSALYNRNIALGQQIGAWGAFDTKVKGASENGPQGFYQTYRQNIGVVQPTYWGGELFAGYRIGRGDFQPWYQERQTNDAGEFKAGVQVPLARNREIDARRAELWKAGYGRSLAEPSIQAELIQYVQEGSYAYWDWVAAGEYHQIAQRILVLADDRTNRIKAQVDAGLIDPPELTDNLRLVAIRQAKVADTRRKLEQTAAKLSVFLRDEAGQPMVATDDQLPGFPEPTPVDADSLQFDIQQAQVRRPELRMLDLIRQQIQVDLSEASNQMQPELNAVVWGSQDVGEPTSSKRDKSPYESEASLYLDVPMQRRKARGKITELQGKMAQISAKRRITADKISVDVQTAHAALRSAWEQVLRTRESLRHAEDLAERERQNQEAGVSDLLKVTLREQYAVESAEKNVEALKLYFESQADYRAAMAFDSLVMSDDN